MTIFDVLIVTVLAGFVSFAIMPGMLAWAMGSLLPPRARGVVVRIYRRRIGYRAFLTTLITLGLISIILPASTWTALATDVGKSAGAILMVLGLQLTFAIYDRRQTW